MSHDGKKFIVEEVIRHETGPSVVMNSATFSDNKHSYLVAGQESHCQLYNVKNVLIDEPIIEDISDHDSTSIRKRKDSYKQKADKNKNIKRLTFKLVASDTIQTDFNTEEPIQRVIRISGDGKFMATGINGNHKYFMSHC